jgi:short-subunit dehydrogenase
MEAFTLGIAVAAVVSFVVWVLWLYSLDADPAVHGLRVPPGGFRGCRVAIVGASTGIGRDLALRLARDGASLALCARSKDKLVALAEECKKAGSPLAVAVEYDVLAIESHDGLAKRIEELLRGPVDVLVNNAGRSQRSLAQDTELKVTRDMFELNVFGNISVTKSFLSGMLTRRRGHIVVTSSVAGKLGSPISSSYSATKHALQGYYSALRNEVSFRGIDVTLVCPGPVESEIVGHGECAMVCGAMSLFTVWSQRSRPRLASRRVKLGSSRTTPSVSLALAVRSSWPERFTTRSSTRSGSPPSPSCSSQQWPSSPPRWLRGSEPTELGLLVCWHTRAGPPGMSLCRASQCCSASLLSDASIGHLSTPSLTPCDARNSACISASRGTWRKLICCDSITPSRMYRMRSA